MVAVPAGFEIRAVSHRVNAAGESPSAIVVVASGSLWQNFAGFRAEQSVYRDPGSVPVASSVFFRI